MQQSFLGYLLDTSELGIAKDIKSPPDCSAEQRLALYANAYRMRLKEALSTDFERLHTYLGDDLFETLMQRYIDSYPSHHTSLRYFGQHMAELLSRTEPFCDLPEVEEIARIELAFGDSFDAANCNRVNLDDLAAVPPDAWPDLNIGFHAAVQLLPQLFNSFQIWRALSNDETPPEKTADASTWLIWRQDLISRYRALAPAELTALSVALGGDSFAGLCEALLNHFDADEVPQRAVGYLQLWINDQMVCALT